MQPGQKVRIVYNNGEEQVTRDVIPTNIEYNDRLEDPQWVLHAFTLNGERVWYKMQQIASWQPIVDVPVSLHERMRKGIEDIQQYVDQTYSDLIGSLSSEWLAARYAAHILPITQQMLDALKNPNGKQ
jgi:hypothetical protein